MAYEDGQYFNQDFDRVIDKPFPVHRLITYDLTARWRLSQGTTISAGGRNVFHARPPR